MSQHVSGLTYLESFLKTQGVRHLFGVPGMQIEPLYTLGTQDLTVIFARHECAAGYLAEGYTRLTQQVGVAFAIGGPGCAQLLPAVLNAAAEHLPILYITSDGLTAHQGLGAFQAAGPEGTRDTELMSLYCKRSLRINQAADWPGHLTQLWETALAFPRGPVHLQVPIEFWLAELPPAVASPAKLPMPTSPRQTEAESLEVLGPRVAVLVGELFPAAQAGALLDWLEAEHLPACTTLAAQGLLPPEHPLSAGIFGYAGQHQTAAWLCSELDTLILLGVPLNERNSLNWQAELLAQRQVLALGCVVPRGLSQHVTQQLERAPETCLWPLKNGQQPAESKALRAEWWQHVQTLPLVIQGSVIRGPAAPSLASWLPALQTALPPEIPLFVDAGQSRTFVAHYWQSRYPGQVQQANGLGPMGWALPAALGACLATNQPVAVLLGDGSLLMQGLELSVAVSYELPLCCLVSHNGGWGSAPRHLPGGRETAFGAVDWVLLAQALGVRAFRVQQPSELAEVLEHAWALSGPCLIELPTPLKPDLPQNQTCASALGAYLAEHR